MVRNGIVFLVVCAGCAEVVVEDPPSTLGAGTPMGVPANPNATNPSNTPVINPGNPGAPTGSETPRPLPMNPGGSPSPVSPNPVPSNPPSGNDRCMGLMTPPTEPNGEVLFEDDFEDGCDNGWIADVADGNDLLGAWAVVESETSLVYAQSDSSFSDDSWTVGGRLDWTDVSFETRFRFTAVGDMEDAIVMLAARFQSKESYVYLQYGGDGTVKIRSELDGDSELASAETERVATLGEWITLRFDVQGATVTAFVNDGEVATGTLESDLAFGGIALGVRENAAVEFDDVLVTLP